MDNMTDEGMIAGYLLQRNKVKERNKLWQETHVGEVMISYELNKKRLNLRSAELLRQN